MDSLIQNKLLHYEIQPPEGAWDRIAASLAEDISPAFSQKLYEYEQSPLPVVWQNIVGQLEGSGNEKAKVVPFYIRYKRPLKYSGAVAIFVVLAVATSLLVSKKTESELPAQSISNSVKTKKDSSILNGEQAPNSLRGPANTNTAQQTFAKSKVRSIKTEDTQHSISFDDLLPREAPQNDLVNSSLSPDKYMIYSDGDGNAIRLPKKIFSAFACQTQDLICKQRLQQLRQKFASSAMTTDFTGLLQILKSLQENQ